MNVMIVCSRLCYGGAEHVATMLANGFADNSQRVMILSNLFEPVTYQIHNSVVIKNLVSTNHNKLKKWGSSLYNVRIAIKEFKPDVIIGIMETCSLVAKLASFGIKVPIIMTEHYAFERSPFGKLTLWERFNKFYVNRVYSAVTVLTEADKIVIGKRLKNVYVMPNPLALKICDGIIKKRNVVLAVGRLDAWYVKGFDVLINAFAKVVRSVNGRIENEGWRLQIAGTGNADSLEYLKRLCLQNNVEKYVDFVGFVSDIQSLYQDSSVFVLSSRYEGFGLVLIEAMSQGCACVACDYKGRQSEIIRNSEEGLTCAPDNVDALADSILRLIEDEEYRKRVQKKGIERSKYYSIDNTMDRWNSVLETVVKKQ